MSIFKCKMCGGTIEYNPGDTIGVCDSCGTKQTLPRLDSDRKANLYDRANHFRRNNEFDKAMGIYESILNEDPTDAEAYWSLVLCRYGIEYVEDPATHRRLPTVNRTQFTSVFDDEDYKAAIQNADALQRVLYEDEAKAINDIQKGILEISAKEAPFDVFICYKETDQNGRRTPDSVLATDLYHQLTQEGFKVFFSRITLEDKLGTAYEPYIFAALNSARAMVVLGTKPEYFNAVWVKNEWSRYLARIKAGAKKTLIPAYRDMDPYDLPEEFSHLQAQDMSKLGFMQDLIRGIKKIVRTDEPKPVVKETVVAPAAAATAPLLRRAFMFLEDRDWDSADEYCEKVLDQEPENAKAYLGKLMAELRVSKREALQDCAEPFDGRNNYKKALRFGDEALKQELTGAVAFINDRNENARKEGVYQKALQWMKQQKHTDAKGLFDSIPDYRDAAAQSEVCVQRAEIVRKNGIYAQACTRMKKDTIDDLTQAAKLFKTIPGWMDADENVALCRKRVSEIEAHREAERLEAERRAEEKRVAEEKRRKKKKTTGLIVALLAVAGAAAFFVWTKVIQPKQQYDKAIELYEAGQYEQAIAAFEALDGYKDSAAQIEAYNTAIKDQAYDAAMALYEADRYAEAAVAFGRAGNYKDARERSMELWNHVAVRNAIAAGSYHTVGLKSNGTVVAVGAYWDGQCNVTDWKDMVAIVACYSHTVGLKADGTVVAVGYNGHGQCNVTDWKDIVAIAAGDDHTVGLKSDGTVVAVGENDYGQCDVSGWKDIRVPER